MRVSRDAEIEWELADPAHFSGKGRLKRVSPANNEVPSIKVYRVEFDPRARTHWHSHSGVQTLFVVEGRCRVQRWGEEIREVHAGDTVYILPDEKHWHGAGPEGKMVHLAVNINASTTWLEKVSDEQYSSFSP